VGYKYRVKDEEVYVHLNGKLAKNNASFKIIITAFLLKKSANSLYFTFYFRVQKSNTYVI